MHWIIYGAGGVGGVIGARLALSGERVSLLARGAHADRMAQSGLTLIAPDGRFELSMPVARHPSELAWTGDEVVLLAVKSQASAEALDELRAVAPSTVVACVQNGVANERLAAERFARVIAVVVWLPAVHLEPGVVVTHAEGHGGILDCGAYAGDVEHQSEQLAQALSRSGFSARARADVMRFKHAKLLLNLGNAVQATIGDPPGGTEVSQLLRRLRQEALDCFAAAGISCATREEVRARREDTYRMAELPGYPRGGGSTWQSLARGTGNVETAYLNGEIVTLGERLGIPTPVNRAVIRVMDRHLAAGRAPGATPRHELELEVARQEAAG